MRVVSLLPSATEIVCTIGARESLVGVSHECDYPASVVGLPVVTRPRVPLQGTSEDVHRSVQALLRDALSVYDVETDVLAELRPDVIVTQDLCDVCAVSLADVEHAVAAIAQCDATIVNLHPRRLADIPADMRRVGTALGRADAADAEVTGFLARVRAVEQLARTAGSRPRVLALEWLDPLMSGGLWMPDLIDSAGGTPLGPDAGEEATVLSPDSIAALRPDFVVLKPCGFTVERTLSELDRLPPFPTRELFVVDGSAFFNRPGPRIADSVEILASILHPEIFGEHRDVTRIER